MNKIALVTVNFNTQDDTANLLKSIDSISAEDLSVVIVDNGSKTPFRLQGTHNFKINLIRSEENLGFSGGYNMGIKEALKQGAEYILVVNNDTLLDTTMIQNLLQVIKSNPKIGVVVPKIYFAKGHEFHKDRYKKEELGKVLWYAGGYVDWANVRTIHRGVDEVDKGQYDKTEKVDFATGCCMLFKKEVLEKVGLFDDDYFLYYEDADLNERIKRSGYEIYYVPSAKLVHVNAASSGGPGNPLHDYFITRNQMVFGSKYAPLRSKVALVRQSLRLLAAGRKYQKKAIKDFYLRNLGKGSFK